VPTFDFAGGTVVHITSGVSALVCALYLGKRVGFHDTAMKPHNLLISFIGACLLWVGWFGFNAGSALGASGLATSAFVAPHFGAAAATPGVAGRRVDAQRQAKRVGRHFGLRCRPGSDHSDRVS
jgi:Amt family ammonium transporter